MYKSFNTKADFDEAYEYNGEPEGHPSTRKGLRVHYVRYIRYQWHKIIAQNLVHLLNLSSTDKILFVGAGFGWTAEILEKEYGFKNIICIDTSEWVQANLDKTDEPDVDEAINKIGISNAAEDIKSKIKFEKRCQTKRGVLNEDLLTELSRINVTDIFGTMYDIAISEGVLTCLHDFEALNLSKVMHQVAYNVVHVDNMISKIGINEEGYNWKHAINWKSLLPNDIIINVEGWEMV